MFWTENMNSNAEYRWLKTKQKPDFLKFFMDFIQKSG